MSTKAMVAFEVPEWHETSYAIVRFFLPHSYARQPVMQVNAAYLGVEGAAKLRDLCNEFLADAAQESTS